jgi:hypothetical protein
MGRRAERDSAEPIDTSGKWDRSSYSSSQVGEREAMPAMFIG